MDLLPPFAGTAGPFSPLPQSLDDIEERWEASAKGRRGAWEPHCAFIVNGAAGHVDPLGIRDAADVATLALAVPVPPSPGGAAWLRSWSGGVTRP